MKNGIKEYQFFNRESTSSWKGKGIQKHGGCLLNTPCFIGIVKSLKALVAYNHCLEGVDFKVNSLINEGMNYVLKHELFKRLSSGEPINNHILDLAFPQSYQLNIIKLLELVFKTGNIENEACKSGINYIMSKQKKNGVWQINYVYNVYRGEGYITLINGG